MSSFDLDQLIRESLRRSREPDPHVIAKRLLPRIPEEYLREALTQCLGDRVRILSGHERSSAVTAAERSAPTPGPSRWAAAAGVLSQRYYVAGEWKRLGDCTAEDTDFIADEYARCAAENALLEERFRDLSQRLRATGSATVADLGDTHLQVAA